MSLVIHHESPLNTQPAAIRTCAVVQGNIRRGAHEVLNCLARHFDVVILSTWDDEPQENIPLGNWEVLLNTKPAAAGYTNRNYQRLSTAAGLRRAAELGATHVLKWRTDMLPTKLDVPQLLAWANESVPSGLSSRLVTCAFRNLTVRQDWFSSIPDLFAFADIALMELLWGDDDFDYTRSMNVPKEMALEAGWDWTGQFDAASLYCAEAELFAIFKSRLSRHLGLSLTHAEIAKRYMRLFNHRRLGICWFAEPPRFSSRFRSITQALQYPWWSEWTWRHGEPKVVEWGYPETTWLQKFRRKHLTRLVTQYEIRCAHKWYESFAAKNQQGGTSS